jgi:hypothetical protein
MNTSQKILPAALLMAAATAITAQPAMAGHYWDAGCGCQRAVTVVQPYVPPPVVVNVVRPRVVYTPRIVYETVPAYVAPAYNTGCGACGRGLLTGYAGYGYGYRSHVHYGAHSRGYSGTYGYGPTD